MVDWYRLARYKYNLGTAESFREFAEYYNYRWKTDYPDLYANRWNNSYRPKPSYRRKTSYRRRRYRR